MNLLCFEKLETSHLYAYLHIGLFYSSSMVCPPVQGDNPRALARGLSPAQTDKPWYNNLHQSYQCRICILQNDFVLKFAFSGKGGII